MTLVFDRASIWWIKSMTKLEHMPLLKLKRSYKSQTCFFSTVAFKFKGDSTRRVPEMLSNESSGSRRHVWNAAVSCKMLCTEPTNNQTFVTIIICWIRLKITYSWKTAHIEAPDDFTQHVLNGGQQSLSLLNADTSLMRKAGLKITMSVSADRMKTTITES